MSGVLAKRFAQLGTKTEFIDGDAVATRDSGSPEKIGGMLRATLTGTGMKKSCCSRTWKPYTHAGMLAGHAFSIDGDCAYVLGIADDRHGGAVILHAITMLNALNF